MRKWEEITYLHKNCAFTERTADINMQKNFLKKQGSEKDPLASGDFHIVAVAKPPEWRNRQCKRSAVKKIKREQRAVRRRASIVIAREPIVNIKPVLAPGLTHATI